jgi:hypothetical protein
MDEHKLRLARDSLHIKKILLRESTLTTAANFDPEVPTMLTLQHKIGLKHSEHVRRVLVNPGATRIFVRGHVEAGVRLLRHVENSDVNSPESPPVVAELVALFHADYECMDEDEPPSDSSHEFLAHNAVYHVWTYFREFVQSSFARAGFPIVTLPMLVIDASKPSHPATESLNDENS